MGIYAVNGILMKCWNSMNGETSHGTTQQLHTKWNTAMDRAELFE